MNINARFCQLSAADYKTIFAYIAMFGPSAVIAIAILIHIWQN